MISRSEAEQVHNILIQQFGGGKGIRDLGALESALSRPFQKFDNRDLYESTIDKAAALIESIITNHPFVDGNKRTGYVIMRLFLNNNGIDINATQEEKYNFVIQIAAGKSNFNDIVYWLKHFTNKTNGG